jgi:hypothetical protein
MSNLRHLVLIKYLNLNLGLNLFKKTQRICVSAHLQICQEVVWCQHFRPLSPLTTPGAKGVTLLIHAELRVPGTHPNMMPLFRQLPSPQVPDIVQT